MVGYKFDRLSVLIVDGNAPARMILKAILQAFGVRRIVEASGGREALDALAASNPDLMFVDWSMPDMSGLDFVKAVRGLPAGAHALVPIIMMSQRSQIRHVKRAYNAGVTAIVAKPVSPRNVLLKLSLVIETPRSFVRTGNYFGPCRRRRTVAVAGAAKKRRPARSPVRSPMPDEDRL
jgi:CheY-like chemotaxis protein